MTEAGEEEGNRSEPEMVVFKCESCGDTFPAHLGERPVCPTCNGAEVHEAHEPLL